MPIHPDFQKSRPASAPIQQVHGASTSPLHMSCGAIVRIVWHMTQFPTPYAVRCSRSGRMPCGAIVRAAWKTKQADPCGAARVIPDARGDSLCVFRNKKQHLLF